MKHRILRNSLIIALLLFTHAIQTIAQGERAKKSAKKSLVESPSEKVDKLLAEYNAPNAPGIAVAVIENGAMVYSKGAGMANLEYNIPISGTSVFHVASVSKQFTVFSILLLEQDGKLSIDDDIRKYLPELADYGHVVTLRHLANHTSGIRDIFDLTNLTGIRDDEMMSQAFVVKLITHQKGLNFIPGTQFEYCNSGYILLAEIVQRISGQTFAEFTRQRIFEPLKMKNSFFLDDPEIIIKNRAYSYHQADSIYYKSLLNFSFVGSSGLNTTTEDLCLWSLNFDKHIVGSEAIFRKMSERSKLNSGEVISYALGQELKEYKGLNVIFHGGGDAGYSSYLVRIPENQFSVVVLSNASMNPLDMAYGVIDCYLAEKEIPAPEIHSKFVMDENVLQTFVGEYEVMPGFIVYIGRDKDTLFLQTLGDDQRLNLISLNNYEFVYPNAPHSKIVFSRDGGPIANEFKWHFSDFVYNGRRIEIKEMDISKVDLTELEGRYFSAELNMEYRLSISDSQLVASHFKNDDIVLSVLSPDVFVSHVGYFGKVEIIRDAQQRVAGYYLSAQRARKIRFDKLVEK
jgi:CubicO group peptidase (beta-lactamase class C family)